MSPQRYWHLVRWYPRRWRARYGEELAALMEDLYDGDKVPFRSRIGIMRTGISEHLREAGSADRRPSENVRAGSLLVLCGWALFVVAGAAFAKMTEHWDTSTPRGDRWLPTGSYDTVQVAGAIGALTVFVGVTMAVPAFARFMRDGGWSRIRRPVSYAVVVSTTTTLLTIAMVFWAHQSGSAPHHGGVGTHLVGSVWALLVVATIGTCTFAAISAARQLRLSCRVLRWEGLLALVLTVMMVAVIGGTLVWGIAIATDAPLILSGSGSGLFGAPGPVAEVITGFLMLAGLVLALRGISRVARSLGAVAAD